jgi:phenylalanyl-tRNA synthetase beta chain
VEYNWSVRERDVRLFEIGRVFRAVCTSPGGQGAAGARLPQETLRVAAVLSGARAPGHWSAAGKAPDLDLWDLKGMFEEVARIAGPAGGVVDVDGAGWVVRDGTGAVRGSAGALDADRPPWAATLYGFELDLVSDRPVGHRYAVLPTTPAAERDIALLLPAGVSAAQVAAVIRRAGGPLLESVRVFDEYRAGDERSVAWRLVIRAVERTLRDAEVDDTVTAVLAALRSDLGVERRQA